MVKVTVPVGVPAPGATALTVAVKVTIWPDTDGLTEEVTVVVLLALLTVWVNGEAVLYVAVPELSATGVWGVPSIVNVTVPLGVPAPGATAATVAVNVTDWPETEGLTDEVTVVVVSALLTVWISLEDM